MATPFKLESIVRANILAMTKYHCARDDYSSGVLLDANENAFGPICKLELGSKVDLERYPDPYQVELKSKIARFRNVKPQNIFLGVGSDEAIDVLIRVFCRPSIDSIVILPPTYGMYKVAAAAKRR